MKLSIITINYNNKEGLEKTIESIVHQVNQDFEYIVIDGNSSDGSKDVIEAHKADIDYWVSEKDNGIYNAMNKGIARANGEYCLFINSGDCLFNESVTERLIPHLSCADIVIGNIFYDTGDKIEKGDQPPANPSLSYMLTLAIPHPTSFIKVELMKRHLYDEHLRICSDLKFFLEAIIIDSCSIKTIDEAVTLFDTCGISAYNSNLREQEKTTILKELFPENLIKEYQKFDHVVLNAPIKSKSRFINRILYSIDKFIVRTYSIVKKKKK